MTIQNTFAPFTDESHNQRIATAMSDLVLADETFQNWLGSRFLLMPDPLMEPEEIPPYGVVGVVDEILELGIGKDEMRCNLEVMFVYEEFRDRITPGTSTAYSLIWHTARLFGQNINNRALQVPRYNSQTLVDDLIEFRIVDYGFRL